MHHISVVTVVMNGRKYLEQTIQSVSRQSYQSISHVIVDGGSTDGTLDIIRKYRRVLGCWISEPDSGISDAFNKGIRLCKDGYIIFLGAGDYFVDEHVVANIFNALYEEPELICGRVQRVSDSPVKEVLWVSPSWPSSKFNKRSLLFRMSLPHQGLFTHKRFFAKHGLFDETCRYAMDYDLLLRAYKDFPEVKLVNSVVSAWRAGGVGQDKTADVLKEYDALRRKNSVSPGWVLWLINWFSIGKYFLRFLLNIRRQ